MKRTDRMPGAAFLRRCCAALLVLCVLTGAVLVLSRWMVTAQTTPQDTARQETSPSENKAETKDADGQDLRKRLPRGETELSTARYLEAWEQTQRMARHSTANPAGNEATRSSVAVELTGWTALGPLNSGGRTRALIIHPSNPRIMFAASAGGGIWKTTDGGANWQPLTDFLPNLAVSTLAFDPFDPNIIYAGTGEYRSGVIDRFQTSVALRGAGIFRTTDGGASWTRLANTNRKEFYYVNKIVVSQIDRRRLYAATREGVWQSRDSGQTWLPVFGQAAPSTFTSALICSDMVLRSDTTSDFVFAACGSAVYRNVDAGGTLPWEVVLRDTGSARTSLALAPSDQNIVYAVSSFAPPQYYSGNYQDGLYTVFRSTEFGNPGTWLPRVNNANGRKLNTVLLSNPLRAFYSECGLGPSTFINWGANYNTIAVDPTDADRLWIGAVDLFRSDDGGMNWGLASYSAATGQAQYVPAGQQAIVFHPQFDGTTNRTLFVASNGGIFRTEDARANVATGPTAPCQPAQSSVKWTPLNNGYSGAQFISGQPLADGTSYVGSTQDHGILLGSDASGANGWRSLREGASGYVAADPTNANVLYAANAGLSLQKSTNGGRSFSAANLGLESDSSLELAPFVIDPSDPQRLWAGSANWWRSEDGAASWQAARKSGSSSGETITSLAVSPQDSNYVLLGGVNGAIFSAKSALAANDTTEIVFGSTASNVWRMARPVFCSFELCGYLSSVAYDPTDKNVAYATYSTFGVKHVWKSLDAGATWTNIDGTGTGALPDIPVHSLVVDPGNPARLFVGTDLGLYVSTNGGASWAVETGFPNVVVESLAVSKAGGMNQLYAFTRGRGAWRVPLGIARCTNTLSATRQSFGVAGGTGSVQVKSEAGTCAWTAESTASWITITSSTSGEVKFTVAPHTGTAKRVGTMTIAERSFTVTQEENLFTDTEPPVLKITEPIATGTFTTTAGTITVRGTATDNVGVMSVRWQTDRGALGSASGTSDWVFSLGSPGFFGAISNFPNGPNVITIIATDKAGNKSSAQVAIVSRPPFLISTSAGTGEYGFSGDGGPARDAQFRSPADLALDGNGNLYLVDLDRVRKITPEGIISTVAGGGSIGSNGGDGGPATAVTLTISDIVCDAAGALYIASSDRIRKVDGNGMITTVTGTAGQLQGASGLTIDRSGNFYVAESTTHRVRKIAPNGTISNVAGTGFSGFSGDGGAATSAALNSPSDVAIDESGNLYVADSSNSRIRKITPAGIISTVAGGNNVLEPTPSGSPGTQVALDNPTAVALDRRGNLYVTDYFAHRVYMLSPDGILRTLAGQGPRRDGSGRSGDGGAASQARLYSPLGVVVDQAGNVYIGDWRNYRLRKLTPFPASDVTPPTITITSPVTTAAYTTTSGRIPLSGTASDNVFVAEVTWTNDRLNLSGVNEAFSEVYPPGNGLAEGTTAWTVTSAAINYNRIQVDGPPLLAGLNRITVTAWDLAGNSSSKTLNVTYNPEYAFFTLAGSSAGFSGDGGPGLAAQCSAPGALARDRAGNLYVADTNNHRIRKLTPDGVISTVLGNGRIGGSENMQAGVVELNRPRGVAVDAAGNLFVADTGHQRVLKLTTAGVVSLVAGTGVEGFSGDGGAATAAQLQVPLGLALDAAGNLFVADSGNHRIRKITPAGIITTVAGAGYGFAGDGGAATAALLNSPTAVAVDQTGNLFIADRGNGRVRKVTPQGIISTVAGSGSIGISIDGVEATQARLYAPAAVAVDQAGVLYLTDAGTYESDNPNNAFAILGRIRKVGTDGKISTVAGLRLRGYNTNRDGNAALEAQLKDPRGLVVDAMGVLYLTDATQQQIYKLLPRVPAHTSVSAASYTGPELAPDSLATVFGERLSTMTQVATLPLPTTLAGTRVTVRDSLGRERPAPLIYVSPSQINYLIPPGTAPGNAAVTVFSDDGTIAVRAVPITTTAPGLFAANSDGRGVAAGQIVRVRPNAPQVWEDIAVYDATLKRYVARPIDLRPEGETVFLVLYGTGIKGRSDLSAVKVKVGGAEVPVDYAGAQNEYRGLDQVNLRLPRSLLGRGEVEVELTVEGRMSNVVRVSFR